jgi:hypothetical protein
MHPIRKLRESGHATAADYETLLAADVVFYRTSNLIPTARLTSTFIGYPHRQETYHFGGVGCLFLGHFSDTARCPNLSPLCAQERT